MRQAIGAGFLVAGMLLLTASPPTWAQDLISEAPDTPLGSYIRGVEHKVYEHWHPPDGQNYRPPILSFKIDSEGRVEYLSVKQSSSKTLNEVAKLAVRQSAPFDPLPSGITKPIDVQFRFVTQSPECAIGCYSLDDQAIGTIAPPKAEDQAEHLVDFGPYMAELQRKLEAVWHPRHGKRELRVVAYFSIHPDGHISATKITRSSGAVDANHTACSAIAEASPFRPLPKGFPSKLNVSFVFESMPDPNKQTVFKLGNWSPIATQKYSEVYQRNTTQVR